MHHKIRTGILLLAILSVVLAVFLVLYASAGNSKQTPRMAVSSGGTATQEVAKTRTGATPTKSAPTATPVPLLNEHLSIPSVGINAPIENVGIASDGTLAVPAQQPWTDVGWYQYGPFPGSKGSAVIDGHLDRPGGSPAVFWNLKNMHIGDIVTVTNAKGQTWHFKTIAMNYYAPDAAPLSVIFGNTSGTYLNLITCAGTWILSQKQTTLRLVVYTTLV